MRSIDYPTLTDTPTVSALDMARAVWAEAPHHYAPHVTRGRTFEGYVVTHDATVLLDVAPQARALRLAREAAPAPPAPTLTARALEGATGYLWGPITRVNNAEGFPIGTVRNSRSTPDLPETWGAVRWQVAALRRVRADVALLAGRAFWHGTSIDVRPQAGVTLATELATGRSMGLGIGCGLGHPGAGAKDVRYVPWARWIATRVQKRARLDTPAK
jgi:hypothetical protein